MDTSTYEPVLPTEEEAAVFDSWSTGRPLDGMRADYLLETRDAPPEVLAFLERAKAHHDMWESDDFAKNRPRTIRLVRGVPDPAIRLFDGPWLGYAKQRYLSFEVITAYFPEPPTEGGEGEVLRHSYPVWDTYDRLIAQGDEEGCRRMAGAIYDYINMREAADRMREAADRLLCGTARDLWLSVLTPPQIEAWTGLTPEPDS